jgi:2-iminoacetate synthase
LGVLLRLDDWGLDALLLGHHLAYSENHYWRSQYSLSLPRLRPCTGGIEPTSPISDKGLVQVICAFRLFNEQLEISDERSVVQVTEAIENSGHTAVFKD